MDRYISADGLPLPVGLRLRSADGAVTAWVARDGFTQVKGAGAKAVTIAADEEGGAVACPIPPAPPGELLPDLGVVTCR